MEKLLDQDIDAVLIDQTFNKLLVLKKDKVLNSQGQELGYFRSNVFYNCMHQALLKVRDHEILNHDGQVLGEVKGNELLNYTGQKFMHVEGKDDLSKAKVAAYAFLL